jgi:hypothetical protein
MSFSSARLQVGQAMSDSRSEALLPAWRPDIRDLPLPPRPGPRIGPSPGAEEFRALS